MADRLVSAYCPRNGGERRTGCSSHEPERAHIGEPEHRRRGDCPGRRETIPVQLVEALLDPARSGPSSCLAYDGCGHGAIALALEVEIAPAAFSGDGLERRAIQD